MLQKIDAYPCKKEISMDVSLSLIFLLITTFGASLMILCLMKIIKPGSKNRYHPVAGTVLDLLFNFHRLHDYMAHMSSKYRTYRLLNFFHGDFIYTADPKNVEHILKANFANYGKGWYHHEILKDLLGDGIFTVDGEKWRHQRKTSSYEFSTKILRDFSSGVFKVNAVRLSNIISGTLLSEQIIDIQDLFMKSTLDSVFKVVLGVNLDSIDGTNEKGVYFSQCFDEANEITLYRYADILWKFKRMLNVGSEGKLKKNIKVIDEFVYNIIKRKTEQLDKSNDDKLMKKEDILSRFVKMNETDPKYLKDIILSFIIAGKDTTASALSWFFYMMCKYPNLQDKIAEEVIESTHVADNLCMNEFAQSITEEALDKMQYLHAALTETLRLYPSVPLDGKMCFSDDILPDGFQVRKGNIVSYQPWAMGRMKFIWGDDAEVFRPERWLDESGIFQQESPFKFTAFQAGPRICLGKEFAYRQMKIFSAVLLSNFKFRLSDEGKRVSYRTMLTLQIDGGLHIRAYSRNS